MYQFTVTGATTVAEYFGKAQIATKTIMANGISYYGEELVSEVRAHASGAPGPKVITGRYRDSIRGSSSMNGSVGKAEAWTDEDYGHRLEYGGVSNTQNKSLLTQPYPHFRPALTVVGAEFVAYLERSIVRI